MHMEINSCTQHTTEHTCNHTKNLHKLIILLHHDEITGGEN